MPTMRIFFANGRGDSDADVERAVARVRDALMSQFGADVEVTSGKDDYKANFSRCGSWDAWIRDVAVGIRFADRTPRYHALMCPTREVGKATARIVELALGASKPVLLWEGGQARSVISVRAVDAENWKAGYTLEVGGP